MSTRWTAVITSAGLGFLADVQGRVFNFTRAQCGAGYVDVPELENQTAVSDFKKNLGITSISTEENVTKLRLQLSNTSIATSFNLYQIGVFAKLDNDPEDVLFMIIQADTPDYIPSETESPNFVNDYLVNVIVGNADSVSGTVDVSAYVTVGLFQDSFNEVEEVIKSITGKSEWKTAPAITLETTKNHVDNKQNPHEVTSDQINRLPDSSLTSAAVLTDYPNGISEMRTQVAGLGFPTQWGNLTTHRAASYGYQTFTSTNGTSVTVPRSYVRSWIAADNAWTPWEEMGTAQNSRMVKTALTGVDLNTVLSIGLYHLSTNCINMPLASWNGWLTVTPHAVGAGTDYIVQEATMWTASPYRVRRFQRARLVGVWRPWEEVSLITEQGSNSSGEYIRYADGTQICYGIQQTSGSWETGLALERNWSFPATFTSVWHANVITNTQLTLEQTEWAHWIQSITTNLVKFGVRNKGAAQPSGPIKTHYFMAIGRWR